MTKDHACMCGKSFTGSGNLSRHGKNCNIYQERKKNKLPLNINNKKSKKNNKENLSDKSNDNNKNSDKVYNNEQTIIDLRKEIERMENMGSGELIDDMSDHIEETEDNSYILKEDEKDMQILALKKEIELLKKTVNVNNGTINNNTTNNIFNIHINDCKSENIESLFHNIFSNARTAAYNYYKVFVPGEGDGIDYINPRISKYGGHLHLAKVLYDDKNHPENNTFYWDKREKKAYFRKEGKWMEIELLALTEKVMKNIGNIMTPIVYENHKTQTELEYFAQEMFHTHLDFNVKMVLIDIVEFLVMDEPKPMGDDDQYFDTYKYRHYHQIRDDYKEWIKER